MKDTTGRLAGAVLAWALIAVTVVPAATAQTTQPTPTPSEVTETPAPSETSPSRPEDPYADGVVKGTPIGHNQGKLSIACAAGRPQGLVSPDIDVSGGLFQDPDDGRYWNLFFWLPGNGIQIKDIRLSFTCGGKKYGDVPAPRPSGTPGGGTGKPQVKHVPKGGVETGFGGTADLG